MEIHRNIRGDSWKYSLKFPAKFVEILQAEGGGDKNAISNINTNIGKNKLDLYEILGMNSVFLNRKKHVNKSSQTKSIVEKYIKRVQGQSQRGI